MKFSRLACICSLLVGNAFAQPDFVNQLNPGDRITVDIAGYQYPATFNGWAACRHEQGQCVAATDDDGAKKNLLPRHVKPPRAGAATASPKGRFDPPAGHHTCTAFSGGTLINVGEFTLRPNGSYTAQATSGRWNWDAATSTVSFTGGRWNQQKARQTTQGLNVLRTDGTGGATTCQRQ